MRSEQTKQLSKHQFGHIINTIFLEPTELTGILVLQYSDTLNPQNTIFDEVDEGMIVTAEIFEKNYTRKNISELY